MAQQQQASFLLSKQGKLEVGQRPIPSPQGKQALVKVTAAAVNPLDWKIVDYGIFLTEFPAILGFEGAGAIESVGPEVTEFKKGDRIFFQGRFAPVDDAAFQQYALVDTEIISKIPSNISDDQAATIPVGSMTSLVGLFQHSGIAFPENGPTATGKSVLILGGSSAVGQYGIQLARIAGFSSIITTSSAQHTDYLKSLGATHVFDRNVDAKTIQAAASSPIILALDTVAASNTQLLAFDVLSTPSPAPGAHLAVVLEVDPAVKAKNTDGKVSFNRIYGTPSLFKGLSIPFYQKVGEWLEEGKYVPNRVHLISGGLVAIPEALDVSRKGVSGVKIVVRPQE